MIKVEKTRISTQTRINIERTKNLSKSKKIEVIDIGVWTLIYHE